MGPLAGFHVTTEEGGSLLNMDHSVALAKSISNSYNMVAIVIEKVPLNLYLPQCFRR